MRHFGMAMIVCVCASGAQGATIEYSSGFGPTVVPQESTHTFDLPKFNPTLGTLTKVSLTLNANTTGGTITWDNEAPVASDIELGIGAEVTASGIFGLAAVAIPMQLGSGHVLADNDGAADFLGTDAFSVVGGAGSASDTVMSMAAGALAAYTGVGTFPVSIGTGTETYLSSSGGFGPIDPQPGTADGTVKVIYEYTPVPAPASIGVLAMGAMVSLRRRRIV